MKKRKSFFSRICNAAEGLEEPNPLLPLIEIAGTRRVLVENHRGITQYAREAVCIRVKYGIICIEGRDLRVTRMTGQRLLITGSVDCVKLSEGAAP